LHKILSADGMKALIAKPGAYPVDSTGLFKRGDAVPKTGYLNGVASFAFNHELDDVSDLFENEDGYYIFQVKQKLKKGLQPIAVVKEKIVQTLKDSLQLQKAENRFNADVQKMTDKADIISLAKIDPLIVTGKADSASRLRYIPQVGVNNPAVAAAFALKDGKVSFVIRTKEALFVVKALWHKSLETIPWASGELTALRNKMESENAQKMYYDWYLGFKSHAKITDNLNQFYMD
ncbi:MAG TPA: hypothetical protein VF335_08755, partial [Chitinivibrionales bacterium]